jgi:hypothetical protein
MNISVMERVTLPHCYLELYIFAESYCMHHECVSQLPLALSLFEKHLAPIEA